ncbi:hypothetical protein BM1374166_01149 [Bartonella tribocorum]|nr:hypothetical protein BM1374166_01149 [Bartonella tribocorum]
MFYLVMEKKMKKNKIGFDKALHESSVFLK